MRINWAFADTYQLDPTVDIERIKSIGPTWGSWRTWRGCNTDNVICHDSAKAHDLVRRAFQAVCNLYVPKRYYQDLGRPVGIKLYDGDFDHELDHAEDVITLHIISGASDIVLMAGYDLEPLPEIADRFERHKLQNYHGMIRSLIAQNDTVQYVLVDHDPKLDKAYQDLPNLTCDVMANVLKLLV